MSDLEFAQSCVEGDKQSWIEFLSRYSHLIYNYIYSVLAVKGRNFSSDQVEDIYQEIFHALIKDNYKKLSTYQGKNNCSLASWLRQVTINFSIVYLRRLNLLFLLMQKMKEVFHFKIHLHLFQREQLNF